MRKSRVRNVYGWRDANHHIRSLWYEVDDIIRMVIKGRVNDRWMLDKLKAGRLPHGD